LPHSQVHRHILLYHEMSIQCTRINREGRINIGLYDHKSMAGFKLVSRRHVQRA
jgi:hypothetical protein